MISEHGSDMERRQHVLTDRDKAFIREVIAEVTASHPCRFVGVEPEELQDLVKEARDTKKVRDTIRKIVTEGLVKFVFFLFMASLVIGALVLLGKDASDAIDSAKKMKP